MELLLPLVRKVYIFNYVFIFTLQPGVKIRSSQLGANGTLKVEKPGIKFMTAFKVMVVKTKFIVAKYN